ncbi:MAG TPA: SGNH/GDSL hydrolase family protein [Acidimicrobiales bacterium]
MRRRPLLSLALAGAVTASMAAVGLVASPGVSTAAKAAKPIYISMGDSYSVGYQNPTLGNTRGFTGYVAGKERLQLENFGCGGATTSSLFTQVGCPAGASAATHGVAYPTSDQVDAVLAYIGASANFGKVQLVTVSIGGNDVTSCVAGSNPIPCVETAAATIETNVTNLVSDLDTALGANGDTSAHIVGITYPDVILGLYVAPVGATNPVLAAESTIAFDDLINPTLNTAYTSAARGAFVDVTNAPYKKATAGDDTGTFNAVTGAYSGPTTTLRGFGRGVPAPVAEVCTITWFCNPLTFGDIHANNRGYNLIGSLIVAKLATL